VSDYISNATSHSKNLTTVHTTPGRKRTAAGEFTTSPRASKSRRIDFEEYITDYSQCTKTQIIELLKSRCIPFLQIEPKNSLIEKLQQNGKFSKPKEVKINTNQYKIQLVIEFHLIDPLIIVFSFIT